MKLTTLTEWLFFHIWQRNSLSGTSCPGVLIPDTVIFRWGRPFSWYFTTAECTISRKGTNNIELNKIAEILSLNKNKDNIAARFFSKMDDDYTGDNIDVQTEYVSIGELDNFLLERKKNGKPLLQEIRITSDGHACTHLCLIIRGY